MPANPKDALLRVRNLSKTFGGVAALAGVDLDLHPGEVRALVGQNGSGKSTLIKVLAGVHAPDRGSVIEFAGQPYPPGDPAELAGKIRFVHQDLGLVHEMTVAENMAVRSSVGHRRFGGLTMRQARRAVRDLVAPFGVPVAPGDLVQDLTPVQRTVVALASVLPASDTTAAEGQLVVLDEPTAALPPHEVDVLLRIVRDLAARGYAVLYVSHRLGEIFEIGQTVTVLRNGRVVQTRPVDGLDRSALIELMIGNRHVQRTYADSSTVAPHVALEASALHGRYLRSAQLSVRRGEILGIAGMPGSGSQEIPYCLAGALPASSGSVRVPERSNDWRDVAQRHRVRLPIVPADRLTEGVVRGFNVRENLTLSVLGAISSAGIVSRQGEHGMASQWFGRLAMSGATPATHIEHLSGGNQQKVVLGRCLASAAPVITLCEPTAGVDVQARESLYQLIAEAARDGVAFVVASSDISDLLTLCTRVLVFRDGVVATELRGDAITESAILHAI